MTLSIRNRARRANSLESYDGCRSRGNSKVKNILWVALLICPFAYGGSCPTGQAKDEGALVQVEQSWAEALERQDADAVGCILADEFQNIDTEGQLHDRAESLAHIAHRRPGRNQLSELRPHVYGEFGYVRGLNTVVDVEGKIRAKVRFTDIFAYRDGRWLAVAGQESLVSESAK
jgi:ketosteroid isomerase-like protein